MCMLLRLRRGQRLIGRKLNVARRRSQAAKHAQRLVDRLLNIGIE